MADCEERLEVVLQNFKTVLATARDERAQKERLLRRVEQLESQIYSMGLTLLARSGYFAEVA